MKKFLMFFCLVTLFCADLSPLFGARVVLIRKDLMDTGGTGWIFPKDENLAPIVVRMEDEGDYELSVWFREALGTVHITIVRNEQETVSDLYFLSAPGTAWTIPTLDWNSGDYTLTIETDDYTVEGAFFI